MESVDRCAAACFFIAFYGRSIETVSECMRSKSPSPEKIIFGAGTVNRGPGFAVDKKHVVAFAPPVILILQYGHGYACELSAAASFHPDIVAFAIEIWPVVHP